MYLSAYTGEMPRRVEPNFWCYADGEFTYSSKEQLIDFCAKHMASESWPEQQVRAHMEALVPTLNHWK